MNTTTLAGSQSAQFDRMAAYLWAMHNLMFLWALIAEEMGAEQVQQSPSAIPSLELEILSKFEDAEIEDKMSQRTQDVRYSPGLDAGPAARAKTKTKESLLSTVQGLEENVSHGHSLGKTAPNYRYITRQNIKKLDNQDEGIPQASNVPRVWAPKLEQMKSVNLRKGFWKLTSQSSGGWIYIAQCTENQDYLKIGFTTSDIPQRIRQLSSGRCKRTFRVLTAFAVTNWLQRVEWFIATELQNDGERWKETRDSCRCLVQHREWYSTNLNRAIQIAKGWVMWMETARPFDVSGKVTPKWETVLNDHPKLRTKVTVDRLESIRMEDELRAATDASKATTKYSKGPERSTVSLVDLIEAEGVDSADPTTTYDNSIKLPTSPSRSSSTSIEKHGLLTPPNTHPSTYRDRAVQTEGISATLACTPKVSARWARFPNSATDNTIKRENLLKALERLESPSCKIVSGIERPPLSTPLSTSNSEMGKADEEVDGFMTAPSSPVSIVH